MHINIDFSQISERIITFDITFRDPIQLQFDALTVGNGIELRNLTCDNPFTVEESILTLSAPSRLNYELYTIYQDVVGDDRDVYMMYPFINEREVFFGVGAMPYPVRYADVADEFSFSYTMHNVPSGWQIFSNLDWPEPVDLEGFFVYIVNGEPESGAFEHCNSTFRWLKQPGKDIPLSGTELNSYVVGYIGWLEENIGPFLPAEVNFLFMQVPQDFEELSNHRTFATGQNFQGGILTVGPNNPDYLRKTFGYDDYRFFLFDGITHELMHYYTTSSWQGKYKSYLYPTADASPYTRRLIGEALNIYFHRQYLYQFWDGTSERFHQVDIPRSVEKARQRGVRAPLADLHLLDRALHEHGTTLLKRFQHLVTTHEAINTPRALVLGLPEQVTVYVDEHVVPPYLD